MKVRELIEVLKDLDLDTEIMVEGYENGLEDVSVIEKSLYVPDVNSSSYWYYGRHGCGSSRRPEENPLPCYVITRDNPNPRLINDEKEGEDFED